MRLSTLRKRDPGIAPGPYLQLSRLRRRRRRRKVHSGTDAVNETNAVNEEDPERVVVVVFQSERNERGLLRATALRWRRK